MRVQSNVTSIAKIISILADNENPIIYDFKYNKIYFNSDDLRLLISFKNRKKRKKKK